MKLLNYNLLLIPALLIVACSNTPKEADLINREASFPANFDLNKLGLKVITSSINHKQATMSTLYGNAAALKKAMAGGTAKPEPGEVFALVTWKQKADGHWFGANIPGDLQSAEILKTDNGTHGTAVNYVKYSGKGLTLSADTSGKGAGIQFILNQKASVMP